MNRLTELGLKHGTDKATEHNYTEIYHNYFKDYQDKQVKLLEIGVGGYGQDIGGASLRMWKEYFIQGQIYSFDIHDKVRFSEERIKIFRGSQVDPVFLSDLLFDIGEPDIIIDDGSHISEHIIFSFKHLFPFLKTGGIYVIEDTQTSYWKDHDKSEIQNYGDLQTTIKGGISAVDYFKKLSDGLNYQEFIKPGYKATYYDKNIVSIHFYHNLIFIFKGDNTEKSNKVRENTTWKL